MSDDEFDELTDEVEYETGLEDDESLADEIDSSAPSKKKPSSSVKILLILAGVGFVGMLLCIGAIGLTGYYFVNQVKEGMTEDPAEIAERTDEIIGIEILPGMNPLVAMRMNVIVMKMNFSVYGAPHGENVLLICDIQMPDQTADEDEFRRQLGNQGFGEDIDVTASEIREIETAAGTLTFEFAEGTNGLGNTIYQVTGMIPSRSGGVGFLMLQQDEQDYDEAAVVKMLESITE